jgi:hypothetical protein
VALALELIRFELSLAIAKNLSDGTRLLIMVRSINRLFLKASVGCPC